MKLTLIAAIAALSAFGASVPAFATSCEWGQRSNCVDSDRAYDNKAKSDGKSKPAAANPGAHRSVNDLGGQRRG